MEILEIGSTKKVSHTLKVLVNNFIFYMFAEVVGNKIESIEPSSLSKENFERLTIRERAEIRNFIAAHISTEYPKHVQEEMLKAIFIKTGGREENPEIAKVCATIALNN